MSQDHLSILHRIHLQPWPHPQGLRLQGILLSPPKLHCFWVRDRGGVCARGGDEEGATYWLQ